MSATLDVLRDEHRKMAKLLTILNREVRSFNDNKAVDFELVDSILEYSLNFPDACHHPKEDVVYRRLCELDSEAAKAVGNLAEEHEELHQLTKRFAIAVENVLKDQTLPRDWFTEIAEDYLRFLRRHMQMEEVVFFPAAQRALSDEDWKAVDDEVFNKTDLLFDDQTDERFEALRKAIMLGEGDPD